jgi:hypothetical protein
MGWARLCAKHRPERREECCYHLRGICDVCGEAYEGGCTAVKLLDHPRERGEGPAATKAH